MDSEQFSKLKSAGETAEKVNSGKPVGSPVVPCPLKDAHWMEIEILSDEDKPVANLAYLVTGSDGREYRGKTNADGIARIKGIAEGECRICFTELDQGTWDAI